MHHCAHCAWHSGAMTWLWFLGALVLGGALLTVAVVSDRRAVRRAAREAVVVPKRGDANVDAYRPTYTTQHDVDRLPEPEARTDPPQGRRIDAGLAPSMVPSRGRAFLETPNMLLVQGEVDSIRQLLPVLHQESGLVIVANDIADEVACTLQANRKWFSKAVLALIASPEGLQQIADYIGRQPLTAGDLRAGYVPEQAYGKVSMLEADAKHVWIVR